MIDWTTLEAGKGPQFGAKLGDSEYADGSGATEIHFSVQDFSHADWIRVPSNFPGPEAGQQLRVVRRFRSGCPCCRTEQPHLHAGGVGVIDCGVSKEFKFYRADEAYNEGEVKDGSC